MAQRPNSEKPTALTERPPARSCAPRLRAHPRRAVATRFALDSHHIRPLPPFHVLLSYLQQYSPSIPKTLNDNFAQHVRPLSHYELQGAAGGRGARSQHMNMAIKRHLLARLRFAWPQACIFAKLVTKVAKQSSANVVLLQTRRHRPRAASNPSAARQAHQASS